MFITIPKINAQDCSDFRTKPDLTCFKNITPPLNLNVTFHHQDPLKRTRNLVNESATHMIQKLNYSRFTPKFFQISLFCQILLSCNRGRSGGEVNIKDTIRLAGTDNHTVEPKNYDFVLHITRVITVEVFFEISHRRHCHFFKIYE